MSSNFVSFGGLGKATLEAHERYENSKTAQNRLAFYIQYLVDVMPWGVSVVHVPTVQSEVAPGDLHSREELRLYTPWSNVNPEIFMSGLAFFENTEGNVELVAGNEARNQWGSGLFAPDGLHWRFFTIRSEIKFFKSYDGTTCGNTAKFGLFERAEHVVIFLQHELDQLEAARRARLAEVRD